MFHDLKKFLGGGQLLLSETAAADSPQHFSQTTKLSYAFVCLFAMIVLCIFPFQFAHASYNNYADIDGVEYIWYRVDASGQLDASDGQFACVEYIEGSTQSAIKVPSTIGGLPVTRFGEDGKAMTLTNVSSIDLSSCSNLEYVNVSNATSQINSLNVANCSKLKTLYCQNVSLTSLNVSGCSSLEQVYCQYNKLTSLNISDCTALKQLSCYDNSITSLNISSCAALSQLHCSNNKISDTSALESWLAQSGHSGTVLPQNGSGGSSTDPGTSKVNIANCTVSGIADQKYTGKALMPKPTVKNGNTTLKEGTDYTLTYKNNVNAGYCHDHDYGQEFLHGK